MAGAATSMPSSQDQFEGFSGAPEPFRGGGSKYFFQAQFPDMTGLIGQYAQGNEPAFHIPTYTTMPVRLG